MAPSRAAPGALKRLWFNWKMMRLPWRKKWLVGFDLQGNTFWEFKDASASQRARRIVKYSRWTPYSDVNVPPQWMQWLRYTRHEPPSLTEQQADVQRQQRMKVLAAQADARWAAKPSVLDAPDRQQPVQMLESRDRGAGIAQSDGQKVGRGAGIAQSDGRKMGEQAEAVNVVEEEEAQREEPVQEKRKRMMKEPKDSPWKQAQKGNPGEDWQPKQWAPSPAKRRA